MGVAITADGGATYLWRGSYAAFSDFRQAVAAAAGIELFEMEGYAGNEEWDRTDALSVLLDHSDCEGSIAVWQCEPLAERLEQLEKAVAAQAPLQRYASEFFTTDELRAQVRAFAAGLRAAAAAAAAVRFY